MNIRDRSEAFEIARAYAWARQDQAGNGQDMDDADAFAHAWADGWQSHREEWGSGVNLAAGWRNYLRDGTVREPHECAVCGVTARLPLPEDPALRCCGRCAEGRAPRPPADDLPAEGAELAHLYAELLSNTGGNRVGDLLAGGTDVRVNLPLAMLEVAVQSQAALLANLHRAGLLRHPREAVTAGPVPAAPSRAPQPATGQVTEQAGSLTWTSAGTSEPLDQVADSERVRDDATRAYYVLGPAYTAPGPDGERWALRKIHKHGDDEVADIGLGLHDSEREAKQEAERHERHGL